VQELRERRAGAVALIAGNVCVDDIAALVRREPGFSHPDSAARVLSLIHGEFLDSFSGTSSSSVAFYARGTAQHSRK